MAQVFSVGHVGGSMVDKDQSRLDAVLDTVVDGIILIDARGHVLRFNPACEKLFGYLADEVIGQNVKMLMPEPFRAEHDGYLDNYRRTGERKIIGIGREVMGRRKDGSTFPMDLSVGEAVQDGDAIFVGVIHDLTERKAYESAILDSALRLRAVLDTAVDGVILTTGAAPSPCSIRLARSSSAMSQTKWSGRT